MTKLKAKQLVQERMFRKRLQVTQQGLHSIAQQLTIMHSSQHSQQVLAKTTQILAALNSKMNISATYKMIQVFFRDMFLHVFQNTRLSNLFKNRNSSARAPPWRKSRSWCTRH